MMSTSSSVVSIGRSERTRSIANELVLVEDRDAGFGYVDRFGHVVIECQYDWATPFVEGVAQVGKWIDDDYYEYYIDTTGNEINLMMN